MVLERVCLGLLNSAHSSALVEFFEEHIVDIMASIEDLKTGKVKYLVIALTYTHSYARIGL